MKCIGVTNWISMFFCNYLVTAKSRFNYEKTDRCLFFSKHTHSLSYIVRSPILWITRRVITSVVDHALRMDERAKRADYSVQPCRQRGDEQVSVTSDYSIILRPIVRQMIGCIWLRYCPKIDTPHHPTWDYAMASYCSHPGSPRRDTLWQLKYTTLKSSTARQRRAVKWNLLDVRLSDVVTLKLVYFVSPRRRPFIRLAGGNISREWYRKRIWRVRADSGFRSLAYSSQEASIRGTSDRVIDTLTKLADKKHRRQRH